MSSSRPNFPHVPTPGWTTVNEDELLKISTSANKDTSNARMMDDDEDYVRKHDALAQQERARWGYSMKKLSGSAKSRKSRQSNPKSVEAVYPTAMESYLLVEEAKKRLLNLSSPNSKNQEYQRLRRNLVHFSDPLDAFCAIEQNIQSQKTYLKNTLNARKSLNSQRNVDPNGSSETASKRLKTNMECTNFIRTVGRTMPEALTKHLDAEKPPASLDVALLEFSLKRLEDIEKTVSEKSSSLYRAIEDLLKQARVEVPTMKSFLNMKKKFVAASNSVNIRTVKRRTANGSCQNGCKLSKIIKENIDPNTYPVAANAFCLSENYSLDGVDNDWPRRVCGKRKKSVEREREEEYQQQEEEEQDKDVDDGTVSSHGFQLELYKLSDDDDGNDSEDVGNPLIHDVWTQVRKRLIKQQKRSEKRKNKGIEDDDDVNMDFLHIESDVNINIGIQSLKNSEPHTLLNVDASNPIHEDDEMLLHKPFPELKFIKTRQTEPLIASPPNSPLQHSSPQGTQRMTAPSRPAPSSSPPHELPTSHRTTAPSSPMPSNSPPHELPRSHRMTGPSSPVPSSSPPHELSTSHRTTAPSSTVPSSSPPHELPGSHGMAAPSSPVPSSSPPYELPASQGMAAPSSPVPSSSPPYELPAPRRMAAPSSPTPSSSPPYELPAPRRMAAPSSPVPSSSPPYELPAPRRMAAPSSPMPSSSPPNQLLASHHPLQRSSPRRMVDIYSPPSGSPLAGSSSQISPARTSPPQRVRWHSRSPPHESGPRISPPRMFGALISPSPESEPRTPPPPSPAASTHNPQEDNTVREYTVTREVEFEDDLSELDLPPPTAEENGEMSEIPHVSVEFENTNRVEVTRDTDASVRTAATEAGILIERNEPDEQQIPQGHNRQHEDVEDEGNVEFVFGEELVEEEEPPSNYSETWNSKRGPAS